MELPLRLRDGLRLELAPSGKAGEIVDGLLTRTVGLGAIGIALAEKLDGTRTAPQLIEALVATGAARERVEGSLRSLVLLHLIEGIGDDVRARIALLRAGDASLEYRALPDARFACQSSSQCCRSYRLGPVQPAEEAAILALPLREQMPDLPPGDLFLRRRENDETEDTIFLRTVGARCVFLRPNLHCGIHAHFGEAKKPQTCRFYPLEVQLTYEGARLYDKGHCASHFVSQDDGPTLIDTARLLRPKIAGTATLFHPIVFLREDTPIDFSHFLVLEAALRDAFIDGDPIAQLQRGLALYDTFVDTVRGFDPVLDPAVSIAAWQAGAASIVAPTTSPDWPLLIEMLDQITYEVTDYLSDARDRQGADREAAPLASQALPIVNYLYHRAVAASGQSSSSLDDVVERARPAAGDDFVVALRRSLTSHFYGRLALPDDRPLLAIGQAAIAIAAAFVGAQRIAASEARDYRVADLSQGHMLAMRALLTFALTQFKNNPERVRALVAALPALCNWPPGAESGRIDA